MTSVRRLSALLVAVLMAVGCLMAGHAAPSAVADPLNPGEVTPPPDPAPPIAWSALGRSDRIDILGADEAVDADIPVPQGVSPGLLIGQIGSVANTVDGRVDVLDQRGVVLGSITAPADATSAPFTVDISGAQVIDDVVTLSFVLRDHSPPTDSCTRPPSVTLGQLATSYVGPTPYPARVADFEPGYIDQFVIRTGPFPTAAQQQAALDLVAKLTRSYRPMPVRVDIDTSPDAVPPDPVTRRVIELREANSPGMTVQNPDSPDAVLVISGRGSELSRQVQLFADRRIELAQASSATVKSAAPDVPKGATVQTFAQLGITGDISVLGTATLYIGIDAGRFGVGSIQQASMHLIAHYTPVASGEGSVVIRSGDSVLATRKLDDSGLLDITGTIPAEAIQSNIGVGLQLRYLPSQRCAPLNDRMQFTLDPGSSVAVTPGTRNRGGFPVLPMAFAPGFDVAIDSPDHLRYAGEAINLLAQQTALTLQPRVTSLPEAARSGSGALILASGEDLSRVGLNPPMVPQGADSVDITGAPATDVDLNGATGVIQAFSDHGRTVLAIDATGDWSLVGGSFDYIRALPSRWASLTGDVVATGAAGKSVNLTLREGGPLVNRDPGDGWRWWTWLTAASVAAALLTIVGVLLWRRRSGRASPAP
jgi:hypothetical protein